MKVRLGALCAIVFGSALSACKKEAPTVVPAKATEQPAAPAVFVVPEDGLISPEAARAYAEARAEMVLVNARLLDSLGASTPERKAVFARALELACETVARRKGLRGAREYLWIQEQASALPQNRDVLAQAGVIVP